MRFMTSWRTLKWGIIIPNLPPLSRCFRYNQLWDEETKEYGADAGDADSPFRVGWIWYFGVEGKVGACEDCDNTTVNDAP